MISCNASEKRASNSNNFYKRRKMDIMLHRNPDKLSKGEAVELLVSIRRILAVTTADMIDKIADDRETDIENMVHLISRITRNL